MLGEHLRNLRNVDGGDRQVTMFLKEEGFPTTIRAVHQVPAQVYSYCFTPVQLMLLRKAHYHRQSIS